jgi:predicted ester cyclase
VSTPGVVDVFYSQIWNCGDLAASSTLLSTDFRFRGSLGAELRGHDAFADYVRSVRGALADYHCEILDCVTEQNKAFAKMRFSGTHVAPFRGYQPKGKRVHWLGAALCLLDSGLISEVWVLGDLAGLDALLEANAKSN